MSEKGRTRDLLAKAAKSLDKLEDPFDGSWLIKNNVTADECITLSTAIAIAIRFYLKTPVADHLESALRESGLDETITAEAMAHFRFNEALRKLDKSEKKDGSE